VSHNNEMRVALEERAALRQLEEEEKARRVRRAVADVLDGTVTLTEALRNRNVPEPVLRAALVEAGWQSRVKNPPSLRRRTFGSGGRKA
jgi:hypothetical protein